MLCDAAWPMIGEPVACGVPYGYENFFKSCMKAYVALSTFCDTSSKSVIYITQIAYKLGGCNVLNMYEYT